MPSVLRRARPARKAEAVLRPVHPNAGVAADYRRRLVALVGKLHASVVYWLKASYRAAPPETAEDASPAAVLRAAVRRLARRWTTRFDGLAQSLAKHFTLSAAQRSDGALKAALKRAGFTVEFKATAAQNDVIQSTIGAQVALIKSIPAQYLGKVEALVMRSVQTGRDVGQLAAALEGELGVAKRRAAFIAQSQNNIATAAMQRARQVEIGVREAVWVHSHAGKKPRPSHVKAGAERVRYEVAKGWWDPDERVWTWPGVLPRCRCVGRSVVPGFA